MTSMMSSRLAPDAVAMRRRSNQPTRTTRTTTLRHLKASLQQRGSMVPTEVSSSRWCSHHVVDDGRRPLSIVVAARAGSSGGRGGGGSRAAGGGGRGGRGGRGGGGRGGTSRGRGAGASARDGRGGGRGGGGGGGGGGASSSSPSSYSSSSSSDKRPAVRKMSRVAPPPAPVDAVVGLYKLTNAVDPQLESARLHPLNPLSL
jgi:hypothetical protein